MFSFLRPLTGDPASEMEAFIDIKTPAKQTDGYKMQHPAPQQIDGFDVGRVVGRKGQNFLVQVGDEVREVPPTDIQRVIR